MSELKEHGSAILELASKVVRASLDQSAHERLIEDTLAKLDDPQMGEPV